MSNNKILHFFLKLLWTIIKVAFVFFAATFTIYMFNLENKLIYYVVRPLLNKHYNSQVRDRKI